MWARKGREQKKKVRYSCVFVWEKIQIMSNRLQYLHQLLEASPEDSFLLFALAKEHEGNNDLAQAQSFYLRLKQSDADYIGTYYHLGKLYEQLNEYQNAILTYKEGIAISRRLGDRHAMSELQAALLNLEDPE